MGAADQTQEVPRWVRTITLTKYTITKIMNTGRGPVDEVAVDADEDLLATVRDAVPVEAGSERSAAPWPTASCSSSPNELPSTATS
jgi:hypothetical protein